MYNSDTGAMTSVASKDHFANTPLKSLRAEDPHTHTLTAVNREQINIYGIKQATLAYQNLAIPTTFTISDVNCAILGLDVIKRNGLRLSVNGYRGHLGHDNTEVRLHYIGNHFYLEATYNWYDEYNQDNMVYGLLHAQPLPVYGDNIIGDQSPREANILKTLKAPMTPSQSEIDEHNLTHLPYRDRCKRCVQGKSRLQDHQQGGLTEETHTCWIQSTRGIGHFPRRSSSTDRQLWWRTLA
eukprot:4276351-Amphidinium_carterae.1